MSTALVLAWWILIQNTSRERAIPEAMGPYPNERLCRIAGHAVIPDDERFWTLEIRTEMEHKQAEDEKRRAANPYRGEHHTGPFYKALTACVSLPAPPQERP